MAKISQQPQVNLSLTFTISEAEARALNGLTGYDFDSFVRTFYEKLGTHYLRPHEDGLRQFFESIRENIPPILARADAARKAFNA